MNFQFLSLDSFTCGTGSHIHKDIHIHTHDRSDWDNHSVHMVHIRDDHIHDVHNTVNRSDDRLLGDETESIHNYRLLLQVHDIHKRGQHRDSRDQPWHMTEW